MTCRFAVFIALLYVQLAFAQHQTGSTCQELTYEDRNQTDYGPLQLSTIRGTATDKEGAAVPKVCIGVFTESGHKLIAAVQTDDNGNFELNKITEGSYRLVAKFDGFSPANVKLHIKRSRSKKQLTVKMRFAGVDTSSYVELK